MPRTLGPRDDTVRNRAREVVRLVEAEGSPAHVQVLVRCFAEHAPEVLSLGPVPATFATRVLHGLCSTRPGVRQAFLDTVRRESQPPSSPTVAGMLRAGLLAPSRDGGVDVTPRGRELLARLERDGAVRVLPETGHDQVSDPIREA